MQIYQIFFASNESRLPKHDQKLQLIPMDSLNHAVSTRFNNLPFLLRATDKLKNVKTNLLKHIFQTIQFCMSFLQHMFCLFFCHIMKNIHEVEYFVVSVCNSCVHYFVWLQILLQKQAKYFFLRRPWSLLPTLVKFHQQFQLFKYYSPRSMDCISQYVTEQMISKLVGFSLIDRL